MFVALMQDNLHLVAFASGYFFSFVSQMPLKSLSNTAVASNKLGIFKVAKCLLISLK